MKPFKLYVNWICWEHYGEPAEVELHILGEEPRVLRRFPEPLDAVGWARKWFEDRGLGFVCDVDRHQREGHLYIVMHAHPGEPGKGYRPREVGLATEDDSV